MMFNTSFCLRTNVVQSGWSHSDIRTVSITSDCFDKDNISPTCGTVMIIIRRDLLDWKSQIL